jgi:hypothetical protein
VTVVTSGCHVTSRYTDTRRGEARTERTPGSVARALPPSMDLDAQGRLRFVVPYICPMQTVTEMEAVDVERIRPNPAALVIGVIATSLGVVAGVAGLSSDDPFAEATTYAGVAGVAAGLPLVVGPFLGNRVDLVPRGVQEVRAAAGEEPCGTKPLPGSRATITWSGLRVSGTIDGDGYFAVSPFAFVDAFDVGRIPALVLGIEVAQEGGTLPLEVVLDAAALAGARDGYFERTHIDAAIGTLRKVPRLEAGMLRVSRVKRDGDRGVRLVLPLTNAGPGDAYGVRLAVAAANPELDGRIIYVGRLPARTTIEVDGVIPVSEEADRALASELEIAVLLRDAHDTAPSAPVRFRGAVLHDPSR